jgi:outer membrane protein assembly factor BamB
MKCRKLSISVILTVLMLSGADSLFGQDWPQWRGANRDGVVTGFSAPGNWPGAFTLKWKVDVGLGDATPALVGNHLYVFTRQNDSEVVLCLQKESGKVLWRDTYEAQEVTGAAARHPGPRSSPVVAEGKIVTLGAVGILSCLDAATGKVLWRKDPFPGIVPMFFTAMSPMIVDGMCIAHLGGAGKGAIVSYNLDTGDEIWRWSKEGPEYASPVLLTVDGTKQIVTLTEKSIVGVNVSDGTLLWKLPFLPERRAYNAATPIIDGQTVIFTGAGRGTRAVTIEKQGEGFVAREKWTNAEVAVQFNTPVLKKDLLFGYSNMGNLFCINAQTGETAWMDTLKNDKGGFAALIDAGQVILALPSSSELIVFEPVEDKYTELARIKIADTPTYAHPVISGNRIYVKDEETLTLWMKQ